MLPQTRTRTEVSELKGAKDAERDAWIHYQALNARYGLSDLTDQAYDAWWNAKEQLIAIIARVS